MEDKIWSMVTVLLGILSFVSWITAVVVDATNSEVAWVIVDLVLPPLGVIRGFLMLIGVI